MFYSPNYISQYNQMNSIKDEIGKKLFSTRSIVFEPLEGTLCLLYTSDAADD